MCAPPRGTCLMDRWVRTLCAAKVRARGQPGVNSYNAGSRGRYGRNVKKRTVKYLRTPLASGIFQLGHCVCFSEGDLKME